jgi:hypothetical protein
MNHLVEHGAQVKIVCADCAVERRFGGPTVILKPPKALKIPQRLREIKGACAILEVCPTPDPCQSYVEAANEHVVAGDEGGHQTAF